MKKLFVLFLVVFLLSPLTGPAADAYAADLTEAQFNKAMDSYLEKYLLDEKNLTKIAAMLPKLQMKMAEAQRAAQMEDSFKNRKTVDVGAAPIKGNPKAKVTIVEFSDFECPFCSRGKDVMEQVLKMYPNDVRVAFKHNPLPMHQQATPASKAAIAAGNQGKFWEMHDLLFTNQRNLNPEQFKVFAQQLGLDMAKFEADMNAEATAKLIASDMQQGAQAGVRGTPNFLVNGVQVGGAQPPDVFKAIIDRVLKE